MRTLTAFNRDWTRKNILKLRIRGNSIRLRLTQPEVQEIGQLRQVRETTCLGLGQAGAFCYTLCSHEDTNSSHEGTGEVSVSWENGSLVVSVPQALAQHWASTDLVAMNAVLRRDDQVLQVLIEKDFKCLTPRPDEDESDTFPNPLEEHGC